MSSLAGEFYADLASAYEVEVPAILTGQPVVMGDPDTEVSVHMFHDDRNKHKVDAIRDDAVAAIDEAADFLVEIQRRAYPRAQVLERSEKNRSIYITTMRKVFDEIAPSQIKTGRYRSFALEAVAPPELPYPIGHRLETKQRLSGLGMDMALGHACLLASAELYSGRTVGRIGKFVRLSVKALHNKANEVDRILVPVSLVSVKPSNNERLALAALDDIRHTAHAVEATKKLRPYRGGLGK